MSKGVKTFADKLAKNAKDFKIHCPNCGEPFEYVKHIMPITDAKGNTLRFKEKVVGLCKCNRSQIVK